jgi:hypothetical protein
VSLAARPTVEIGAGVMTHLGGRGAPPDVAVERVVDLVPVRRLAQRGERPAASNKRADLDVRVRVPRWRGLSVRYELTIDDFDLRRPAQHAVGGLGQPARRVAPAPRRATARSPSTCGRSGTGLREYRTTSSCRA